jgi:hypothetical protein
VALLRRANRFADVCTQGKTGSDRRIVKPTRLTLAGARKPVVNFGWIGATAAFGYRFVDPIGAEFSCVISAALQAQLLERVLAAVLQTYFEGKRLLARLLVSSDLRGNTVKKIVIVVGAMLAVVTAAGAADLPRRQPVYQEAPVGKMPIGKSPIGKTPIGKAPVVSRY